MSDFVNDGDEEIIRVDNGNSKQKRISLKNIEPVKGIQVIRNESPSISSDDSYISQRPKKTKKVLRKRETFYKQPQPSSNNYSSFSNPKKVHEQQNELSDDDVSEYQSESEQSEVHGEETNDAPPTTQKETWEDKQKLKQELLIKIHALEKRGFEFSKKFNMTSNYEEMMFEYEKIKKFVESQAAIKFSRRCLMACVTGLEFLNKRFDPFHLKLEGWSENVMESVEDYDNVFEKLHEKYGGKSEVAPEIELLLMLGGSAFMFHLTNTLLKGPGLMGGGAGMVAQNNPNFMASMMGALSQGMKEASKPPSGPQMAQMYQQQQSVPQGGPVDIRNHLDHRQAAFPKPMDTRVGRQEMRGPSIDQNLFQGTSLANNNFQQPIKPIPPPGPPPGSPPAPPPSPQPGPPPGPPPHNYYDDIKEDDRFSIASSDSTLTSMNSETFSKNITVKKINGKKGNNKKSDGFELNIT